MDSVSGYSSPSSVPISQMEYDILHQETCNTTHSLPWIPTTVPSSPFINRSDACVVYKIICMQKLPMVGTGM